MCREYPELWTLNSELWTLDSELWTLNPGRGSCNKVGSLKRISVVLTSLSNVGVVDLEVCCPIFGIFHFAPRYFNIIDRSKLSVGRVPNCCFLKRGQSLLQFFSLIISVFCYCNKVGSLKRISVLLTYLSNFRLFTKILFSYGFFFSLFFCFWKIALKLFFLNTP